MLHHVSFSVPDPHRAAHDAAALLGGVVVNAPCPPFPAGTRFVTMGDAVGSMIELMPWGSVLGPGGGLAHDPQMRLLTASHVLAGTPHPVAKVLRLADDLGLRAACVDAGLFRFVKVAVAEGFLLELLTPEQVGDYAACFGADGAAQLDARLRNLETALSPSRR